MYGSLEYVVCGGVTMREHTSMDVEIENSVVQEQFGRAAGDYTQSRVHSDPDALNRIVTLAQVRPGDVALDIATGAGHVAMALAPRIAKVIAYDLTEEM